MGEGGVILKLYKPWEFCKAIDCDALSVIHQDQRMKKVYCYRCYAYRMHQYLKDHGQILEEGSELEQLRNIRDAAEKLMKNICAYCPLWYREDISICAKWCEMREKYELRQALAQAERRQE